MGDVDDHEYLAVSNTSTSEENKETVEKNGFRENIEGKLQNMLAYQSRFFSMF